MGDLMQEFARLRNGANRVDEAFAAESNDSGLPSEEHVAASSLHHSSKYQANSYPIGTSTVKPSDVWEALQDIDQTLQLSLLGQSRQSVMETSTTTELTQSDRLSEDKRLQSGFEEASHKAKELERWEKSIVDRQVHTPFMKTILGIVFTICCRQQWRN